MVVTIKIEARAATDMIRGLSVTLPKASQRGMYNLARRAVKDLKVSAKTAGITSWRGMLFSKAGIKAQKRGKYNWDIIMPYYGPYLDAMKTHYVSLKRGRLIQQWAMEKLGKSTGGIVVHAHPFIQTAFLKTAQSSKKIVEKEINKTIRSKGRR